MVGQTFKKLGAASCRAEVRAVAGGTLFCALGSEHPGAEVREGKSPEKQSQ